MFNGFGITCLVEERGIGGFYVLACWDVGVRCAMWDLRDLLDMCGMGVGGVSA
jgi:hypothetical protein